MERAREKIKGIIPKRVSDEDAKVLDREITIEEVNQAIRALSSDKSPSPDGLPVEFYKSNMSWIEKELCQVYSEAITQGTLGQEINVGLIKLIPKEGDKTLVKNWRPITLLNVSYKIMVKVLAKRLENVLPKVINPTQTGFVKGRYILENLLTSWEVMC